MEILRKYIVLVLSILVLFSCEEREEPAPLTGSPELYLIGNFDGKPFAYYAGEDGFYNEAYTYTDDEGETWFAANFRNENEDFFNFDIALQNTDGNNVQEINTGTYSNDEDIILQQYSVEFQAPDVEPGSSFWWDFRDASFATADTVRNTYPLENGAYEVCLTITYPDGCSSLICQTIKPHLPGKLDIISSNSGSGLTILSPQVEDFEAIKYEWTLSNGQKALTKDIAIQNDSSVIEACLEVTNRKSEVYERCIQVLPAGLQNACVSNFNYEVTERTDTIPNSGPAGKFDSEFQFNGQSFTSTNYRSNNLEILNVEPYLTNENGEPTQKIYFQMTLWLSDETGNVKQLNIKEGVIAVGKN